MEVEVFHNSLVFVKRMDRPRNSLTNNKVMSEFAQDIFEVEGLETDKMYTMDFDGAEAKFDFDYKCMSINFFAKEKEDVA